jgi:hypothetical protein
MPVSAPHSRCFSEVPAGNKNMFVSLSWVPLTMIDGEIMLNYHELSVCLLLQCSPHVYLHNMNMHIIPSPYSTSPK